MIQLYIDIYLFFSHRLFITEYWVQFPGLYCRSMLINYFLHSSVYFVDPKLLIYPSPTNISRVVTISLYCMSVSLFLFCE